MGVYACVCVSEREIRGRSNLYLTIHTQVSTKLSKFCFQNRSQMYHILSCPFFSPYLNISKNLLTDLPECTPTSSHLCFIQPRSDLLTQRLGHSTVLLITLQWLSRSCRYDPYFRPWPARASLGSFQPSCHSPLIHKTSATHTLLQFSNTLGSPLCLRCLPSHLWSLLRILDLISVWISSSPDTPKLSECLLPCLLSFSISTTCSFIT